MPKIKKYAIIVKTKEKFLKYNTTNLLQTVSFLDRHFPGWLYINVFDKDTREQITSYTQTNRPTTARPNL